MKRFILHLMATAGALAATAWLMPGITVDSAGTWPWPPSPLAS